MRFNKHLGLVMKKLVASAIGFLFFTNSAMAALYGTLGTGPSGDASRPTSLLVELDPDTGAVIREIGEVGYLVNGMTYDETTGILYATTSNNDGSFPDGLITIDLQTGAGTEVGTGAGRLVNVPAADSMGNLYGWTESGDDLVVWDKAAGTVTVVGGSGVGTYGQTLAFDNTDTLYLVKQGRVYEVDTVTGVASLIGTIDGEYQYGESHHGDFDPETNLLFAISNEPWEGGPRQIVIIDLDTMEVVGTLGSTEKLHTLAFIVDLIDELSLGSLQSILNMALAAPNLALNGAHHRPLMMMNTGENGGCFWANGDIGRYDDDDATNKLVEVGACHDLMHGKMRVGVGIGLNEIEQDLAFGGDADIDGKYVLAEVDYVLEEAGAIVSALAYYGDFDADIVRGYAGGASAGSTNIDMWALRGRIDVPNAFQLGETPVSAYGSYTVSRTEVDAYSETTGPTPASFNKRKHTAREARLGLSAATALSETTLLRGILEGVHRFDDNLDGVSGTVGASTFSLQSRKVEDNWGRVGAELDHVLENGARFSLSGFASSDGEDPDFSGAVSLKFGF